MLKKIIVQSKNRRGFHHRSTLNSQDILRPHFANLVQAQDYDSGVGGAVFLWEIPPIMQGVVWHRPDLALDLTLHQFPWDELSNIQQQLDKLLFQVHFQARGTKVGWLRAPLFQTGNIANDVAAPGPAQGGRISLQCFSPACIEYSYVMTSDVIRCRKECTAVGTER